MKHTITDRERRDREDAVSTIETLDQKPTYKVKLVTRSVEDWFRLHTTDKDQIIIHHLEGGTIGLFNPRNNMTYIMGAEKKL